MSQYEVHADVRYSFSVIIEAESEEAAIASAEADTVHLFQMALEQGDLPGEGDIEIDFAQEWEEGNRP
jgi:hypothetical protein